VLAAEVIAVRAVVTPAKTLETVAVVLPAVEARAPLLYRNRCECLTWTLAAAKPRST
jgi:hypothetical protein